MHLNVADWEILESLMIMLKIQNSVKTNDSEYAFTNLPFLRSRFLRDHNYKAIAYIDGLETLLLMSLGKYSMAEKKLLHLYSNLQQIEQNNLTSQCLDNLFWCYLLQEKFKEIDSMIQHLVSDHSDCSKISNLIFYPYCLYRLDKPDAALEWVICLRARKSRYPVIDNSLLDIQEDLILNRKKTFIRHADKLLNYYDKHNDQDMIRILLKMKIYYYESNSNLAEANKQWTYYVQQFES